MLRWFRCRAVFLGIALGLALVGSGAATAQEEAPETFIYATYFDCDASDQWLADMLVENAFVEHYDAAVDAGTIGAWGWLAHHTGGKWRRLVYHTAPTLEAVIAATSSVNEAIGEESPAAANALTRICPTHDDYVWRRVAGSPPGAERGEVGFSVYFVCDTGREQRADELVRDVIGPIHDGHVGEGKLISWGWNEHIIGGEYRRLVTLTAADDATLLRERAAILEEMYGGDEPNPAAVELSSICGAHQDYIWSIRHEKP